MMSVYARKKKKHIINNRIIVFDQQRCGGLEINKDFAAFICERGDFFCLRTRNDVNPFNFRSLSFLSLFLLLLLEKVFLFSLQHQQLAGPPPFTVSKRKLQTSFCRSQAKKERSSAVVLKRRKSLLCCARNGKQI